MKRNSNKNDGFVEIPCGIINEWEVSRVKEVGKTVMFSLTLNGVSINSCRVVEGKNGDFIALPSYKGSDGKYYSYVFFKFSPDDASAILAEVEKQLNA